MQSSMTAGPSQDLTDLHVPRSEAAKENGESKAPTIEIVLDQPVIDCP
jgi:hypothetical protein